MGEGNTNPAWQTLRAWLDQDEANTHKVIEAEQVRLREVQAQRKAEIEKDIAQSNRAKELNDAAKAEARLQRFSDERGLEPTPENAQLIWDWIDANGLLRSEASVDAAIRATQKQLRWKLWK